MFNSVRNSAANQLGKRIFYGWVIVAVANLGIFASGPGQSHTFSVFVGPISKDLNITAAEIAGAYGAATLIAALLLPQVGRLVDYLGPRRGLIGISLILGVACMTFGAASGFLWLAFGFAFLRLVGQGSMMLASANLVSQWFSKSRGLALSLMALGFALSMAVHPSLAQYLVGTVGWRQAWVILGIMTWLLMLPPLIFLVIDKPEDLGLLPDGEKIAPQEMATKDTTLPTITGLSLNEALKTSSFYVLSLGWFSIAMLVTTLHFWQVTVMTRQGVSIEMAAQAFAISAISMAIAMPMVGRMFDTIRTRYVFATGLLITTTSLIGLTFAHDVISTVVYAVIFGLNNAFSMTMFGYIWPRYFGRKHLGSIQGTGQLVGVVGASLGPFPVGWAYVQFGSASSTLHALAILPALAAIIAVVFLRSPSAATENAHLE